jgi:hypothetical protein
MYTWAGIVSRRKRVFWVRVINDIPYVCGFLHQIVSGPRNLLFTSMI